MESAPALVQLSMGLQHTYRRCIAHEPAPQHPRQRRQPAQARRHSAAARPASTGWAGSSPADATSTPAAGSYCAANEPSSHRVGPATGDSSDHESKRDGESFSSTARRILTKKTRPTGNGGMDNEEQNLIVRVRDVLGGRDAMPVQPDFIVLDMLGQGTFGQVFRCQNVETKEIVAIKVIRNHPSYYKQAVVEVQITRLLNASYREDEAPHFVRLKDTFEFHNHLCLVFELLSVNLYELISENNFNGFPLEITRGFLHQMLHALLQMEEIGVIHCDLKPENVLLVGHDRFLSDVVYADGGAFSSHNDTRASGGGNAYSAAAQTPYIKVVDFGSACMENETVYSYIQSRFYRSPEVLLGIPYTGAIDLWSLGCIAGEMFLGLPLFPGVSEHDQLRLIEETLGKLPQELLRRGRNILKFYNVNQNSEFVLKTPEEYARDTNSEVQISKKYFKFSKLEDMIHAYPHSKHSTDSQRHHERERRDAFLHFVRGLLCVDPMARWTAREAMRHPFMTGAPFVREEVEFSKSLERSSTPSTLLHQRHAVAPLPKVSAPQHHLPSHLLHVNRSPQAQPVWSSPVGSCHDDSTPTGVPIWGPSGMPPYANGRVPSVEHLSPAASYFPHQPQEKPRSKVAPAVYPDAPVHRVYPYENFQDSHIPVYGDAGAFSPSLMYGSLVPPHCKVTPTLSSSASDGYPVMPISPYESQEYDPSYYPPPPPLPHIVRIADWPRHDGQLPASEGRSPWGPGDPPVSWSSIPLHHQYQPESGSQPLRRGKRQHTSSWDNGDTRECRRHEPDYPHSPRRNGPSQPYQPHTQQNRPHPSHNSSRGHHTPRRQDHKGRSSAARHRKSPKGGATGTHHHQYANTSHQHHRPRHTSRQSAEFVISLRTEHNPDDVNSYQAPSKRDEATGVCSVEEKFSSVMSLDVATAALTLPT